MKITKNKIIKLSFILFLFAINLLISKYGVNNSTNFSLYLLPLYLIPLVLGYSGVVGFYFGVLINTIIWVLIFKYSMRR